MLLAVALADGKLDIDEKGVLDLVAHEEYGDDEPPPSRFQDSQDFDRALVAIRSPLARSLTWNGALAIAMVDRGCSKREHALLDRIHRALVPDEPPPQVSVAEAKFDERFTTIRAEIEEATISFLKQIGKGGSAVSQSQYERLATELAQYKKELFARAMSLPPPKP